MISWRGNKLGVLELFTFRGLNTSDYIDIRVCSGTID